MLDKVDVENVPAAAAIWEKVAWKLRTGAMPPAGAPRPDKATYESLAGYLETALDQSAEANPNPGRSAIHRLNRAEYANAVRDLLGVDTDAIDVRSLLPPDDSGYGFDNIGDVLSVSPVLLERYLSAGRKIAQFAIGDSGIPADVQTYAVSRYFGQKDRASEDLPFGSRGGIAIRHWFPLDGEYVIKIRLKRNFGESSIFGLAEPHELDVRLDGSRVKLFTDGGDQHGNAEAADADLEVRLPVKAGPRLVGVAFLKKAWQPEDVLKLRLASEEDDQPSVGNVSIGGPYQSDGPGDTPSRRRILVCRPTSSGEEEPCARKILSNLAGLAYRRPLTSEDIPALLGPYQTSRKTSSFEGALAVALQRILVSPEFLFRIERDPEETAPGAAYRLSDLELASRLSFFLWSSLPDERLLEIAERGELKEPAVLEEQVVRMLTDPRSKALVENFAGQWLYIRNVRSASPDLGEYPDFDENLREAFRQETERFFESQLREDRSVLELLTADYTFLNERLARHYGIPNIYGSHFRRVTMKDENRRGLLGQGSVLMVTSYANRTSPTLRGKWLLESILGAPPPPPPPNVPSLKDRSDKGELLSVRQQMEQHRSNPACASCHARMDPLGFALDNFDAIGRWRTVSGATNTPIDSSGVLPDGTKFQGPAELRKVLLSKPEQFVTAATEKLLTYALGRGLEYYDLPAVRKIVREASPNGYRWSALIRGIITSTPFQMRRSPQS